MISRKDVIGTILNQQKTKKIDIYYIMEQTSKKIKNEQFVKDENISCSLDGNLRSYNSC
jgi:hypothetical protein